MSEKNAQAAEKREGNPRRGFEPTAFTLQGNVVTV